MFLNSVIDKLLAEKDRREILVEEPEEEKGRNTSILEIKDIFNLKQVDVKEKTRETKEINLGDEKLLENSQETKDQNIANIKFESRNEDIIYKKLIKQLLDKSGPSLISEILINKNKMDSRFFEIFDHEIVSAVNDDKISNDLYYLNNIMSNLQIRKNPASPYVPNSHEIEEINKLKSDSDMAGDETIEVDDIESSVDVFDLEEELPDDIESNVDVFDLEEELPDDIESNVDVFDLEEELPDDFDLDEEYEEEEYEEEEYEEEEYEEEYEYIEEEYEELKPFKLEEEINKEEEEELLKLEEEIKREDERIKELQKEIQIEKERIASSPSQNKEPTAIEQEILKYKKIVRKTPVSIDKMIEHYIKVEEQNPDNMAVINCLAWAYIKKGMFGKALTKLHQTIKSDTINENSSYMKLIN